MMMKTPPPLVNNSSERNPGSIGYKGLAMGQPFFVALLDMAQGQA